MHPIWIKFAKGVIFAALVSGCGGGGGGGGGSGGSGGGVRTPPPGNRTSAAPPLSKCRQAPLQYTSQTDKGWLETRHIEEKLIPGPQQHLYKYSPNIPVDVNHIALLITPDQPRTVVCLNTGPKTCFPGIRVPGDTARLTMSDGQAPPALRKRGVFLSGLWGIFPYGDDSYPLLPKGTYNLPLYLTECVGNSGPCSYILVSKGGGLYQPKLTGRARNVKVRLSYQTPTNTQPRLPINLYVIEGVLSGVSSTETALAHPDIQKLAPLMKGLAGDNSPHLAIDMHVCYLAGSGAYAITDNQAEWERMFIKYTEHGAEDRFNVFLIDDHGNVGSGVVGLSPLFGPFGRGKTSGSGLSVEALSPKSMAAIILHEIGHFVGLKHTTEVLKIPRSFDNIADTPECPVGTSPCPDITNIMFPVGGYTNTSYFSKGQSSIFFMNPLVTP